MGFFSELFGGKKEEPKMEQSEDIETEELETPVEQKFEESETPEDEDIEVPTDTEEPMIE